MTDAPPRFEDLCLDATDHQALGDRETPPALRHSQARAGSSQGGDALLAAGATVVRLQEDDMDWDVLADPEGNEFCVFAPRAD